MPIEIKELRIVVKIEEDKPSFQAQIPLDKVQLESIKSELIRECTSKVLEKIKEKSER
ncbi:DUF5908 family protein [Flavobacterium sp. M31R6]|jgi:hypothetical protein|uniref:DUF5908 family protein n=1 Tax=Flavobacterium sp. M31R6 TaxID=2739062 RepID=UPI00156934E3|nr:DUF5908 family protein [Flavobacterium sp. M31R6]QKJ61842.1 hypothetical protein HQN62_01450 [Flavobacterium sp. M31R6]